MEASGLARSCKVGWCKGVQTALEQFKADPNAAEPGGSGHRPLHFAAEAGHADIVRLLLAAGADPNAKNFYGFSPLHEAAERGHVAVVQLLIEAGANVDAAGSYGRHVLHLAAGHPAVVESLADAGADLQATDKKSWTCLHWAAANAHAQTVLCALLRASSVKMLLLIGRGADIEATGHNGWTPLHLGAANSAAVVVRILLEHGSDPTAAGDDGVTPLHCVSQDSLCYDLLTTAIAARAAGKSLAQLGLGAAMREEAAAPGSPAAGSAAAVHSGMSRLSPRSRMAIDTSGARPAGHTPVARALVMPRGPEAPPATAAGATGLSPPGSPLSNLARVRYAADFL